MGCEAGQRQRIVMVDDDKIVSELIKEYLSQHDFDVATAQDSRQFWETFRKINPALVLLDVMLPDQSGFEICRDLRRTSDVPIVILTARYNVEDRVLGLELGADDYLAKPFELRELLARVQAILRRGRRLDEYRQVMFDRVVVNLTTRTAICEGESIEFTTAEFELLSLFLTHPNKALTRDQITNSLRGTEWEALSRSVDIVISRLRQKLHDNPKCPKYFRTIWGKGYMFVGKSHYC